MMIEFSQGVSSPDGMAALAILVTLVGSLSAPEQKHVLKLAMDNLGHDPGTNRKEARRTLATMLGQYGP